MMDNLAVVEVRTSDLATVVGLVTGVRFAVVRVECIICAVVISDGLDVDGSEAVRPSDVVEF